MATLKVGYCRTRNADARSELRLSEASQRPQVSEIKFVGGNVNERGHWHIEDRSHPGKDVDTRRRLSGLPLRDSGGTDSYLTGKLAARRKTLRLSMFNQSLRLESTEDSPAHIGHPRMERHFAVDHLCCHSLLL